jgi:Ca-activated chloride channel homolog
VSVAGFAAPWWLLLLLVVAVLGGGYALMQRRAKVHVVRFANLELLDRVMPDRPGWRRHTPAALVSVALLCMTVGLAGPTHETRVPRNRAIIMLVIDVSLSMQCTDVQPSRIAAAKDAAADFVRALPPRLNLGLESFAGTAAVLVAPTVDRDPVLAQIRGLQLAESTATGDAMAAALQTIHAFEAQIPGGGGANPPAQIVLMSDGKQTIGRDEYLVAAQAAREHIPINTISFGTSYGTITLDGQQIGVPVDDDALSEVAHLSGGTFSPARSNSEVHEVYHALDDQIGYQLRRVDASKPWYIVGTLAAMLAAGLAIRRGQRLPV